MSDKRSSRKRLGRGLGSLITTPVEVEPAAPAPSSNSTKRRGSTQQDAIPAATGPEPPPPAPGDQSMAPASSLDEANTIQRLPVNRIDPNRSQPRRDFDPDALNELAESIRTAGVMQPILVRRNPDQPGRFELIAGERRLRAAKLVPLDDIPAIVRDLDNQAAAEWALIENIQRDDLNPIERAEAFQALIDQYNLTHSDIAERVGINRSSVTNLLRLNELQQSIKDAVRDATLSLGHAKVLLGVEDGSRRETLARRVIDDGWSVRELEKRIAERWAPGQADGASGQQAGVFSCGGGDGGGVRVRETPAYLRDIEDRLGRHLGTRVRIKPGRKAGTGKLIIEFYSLDQFDGLMHTLNFRDEHQT